MFLVNFRKAKQALAIKHWHFHCNIIIVYNECMYLKKYASKTKVERRLMM